MLGAVGGGGGGVGGEYGGRFATSTGSTTTTTTSSRSTTTTGGGGGVRRVRLARPVGSAAAPCAPPTFGFSVRGGREHDTGFFVSHVEPASEAHNRGLKIGDQVVRVNGYRVGDAFHKELLSLISGLNYLKLKVRNVGMIPVKDKAHDPLTWRMIPESMMYSDVVLQESKTMTMNKDDKVKDVRLTLYVPSRSKLGCGICKGPEWRPGIFVQFTKENGIARESGLRPGDQIMQCNGIDFRDIQFSDAVSLMKQAKRLDLWIRTGAGLDLFPGESSGYNSSASSATGDQSPSSADHKRLSIVKEETLDLEDRLSQLDKGVYKRKSFDWGRETPIKESDSEYGNDFCDSPMSNSCHKPYYNNHKDKPIAQNKTIINLSEEGTTIQTNYVLPCVNESKGTLINSTPDKKTIVVDVHRSDCEPKDKSKENVTHIQCQIENYKPTLRKAPSNSSLVSLTNSTNSSSLSNAISQELQKRSQRSRDVEFSINQLEESRKNKVLKDIDDDKKQQHSALMDEFKKAHRRMFASHVNDGNADKTTEAPPKEVKTKLISEKTLNIQNELKSKISFPIDRHANAYSRLSTLQREDAPAKKTNGSVEHVVEAGLKRNVIRSPSQPPPPPPPMPAVNGGTKSTAPTKPKAPPPPPLKKHITNGSAQLNGGSDRLPKPPSTPTPDYDTSSLVKVTPKRPKSVPADIVEMESLDSFKLANPASPEAKPPATYFMKQQNGTLTMKKASQPISVTIGEYPSNTFRKQPSKLEFLGGDAVDGGVVHVNGNHHKSDEPVGSRLQSELSLMLSRSNLKKKTENENDAFENGGAGNEPNANFNKRYGHAVLPQPAPISIPKVPLTKSLSHHHPHPPPPPPPPPAPDQPKRRELTKADSLPQTTGILRHSTPYFVNNDIKMGLQQQHQQKTIKFGQTTTVIPEPEIPLFVNH